MTTPFSTLHVTATHGSDTPTSDPDDPGHDASGRPVVGYQRALVLGGGGSAGNAWVIGVLAGLQGAGLDVTDADLTVGTSAGSTAAAQLGGASPTRLLTDILDAPPPRQRPTPGGSDGEGPRWARWRTTCG